MKKMIIPILFALAGTSFVSYSFLDTYVIPKKYDVAFDANNGVSMFSFSFAEMSTLPSVSSIESSSTRQSSSKTSNSSNKSSSSKTSSSKSSSSLEDSSSVSSSISSSSSVPSSSSSTPSSSSSVPSSSEPPASPYYEDLSLEQIAALFTPEKVFEAKKHYSDSDIYVDITTDRFEDYCTYYTADIRIRNASFLKTALAHDTAGENIKEATSSMCLRKKGVIAIDGDTYGSQTSGYVIRNGQIIRRSKNLSRKKPEDLAIYADGSFEIFSEKKYTIDEIAAKQAWQVFSFGPGLVKDGEITVTTKDEVGTALSGNHNQRCAIGMVAPLHYVFVVSDGRMKVSPGLSLYQIAQIMVEKHVYCAYNLDGGGSATMYFDDGTGNANGNGSLINMPHQDYKTDYNLIIDPKIEEREVSDIVYIGKE